MKIISPKWIITCDDDVTILQNHSIVFYDKIIEIAQTDLLIAKYPNITKIEIPQNSVMMPGLINPHIHFEFSKNKSTLEYGSFIGWLNSVIANREQLIENLTKDDLKAILHDLLMNGTTSVGAISSYGFDLEALSEAEQNVVFFPEVLGSRPDMVDALYADFFARFQGAKELQNERFKPGIAIHSPYSTHPVIIKKALALAKEEDCVVQAHFMESPEEKNWLEKSKGGFVPFFENFLNQKKPLGSPEDFLNLFENCNKISFTHCAEASKTQLQMIEHLGANIIHCPVSNRLLNNNKLNLKNCKNINVALATDGLSSNVSLDLFDELKSALMIHADQNLNELSKKLLYYATAASAKVLDFQKGKIEPQFDADFLIFDFQDIQINEQNIATNIILHHKKPTKIFIGGKHVGYN